MISKRLLILLLLITFSLQAQVKTKELSRNKLDIFAFSGSLVDGEMYVSTLIRGDIDTLSNIFIYDTVTLQIKDSIRTSQTGRSNVYFRDIFRFNNKDYVLATPKDTSKYGLSRHQIQGNNLIDSNSLGLDTLLRPFVANVEVLESNKLRLYVYTLAPNHYNIVNTRIVDLDSNFKITDYHVIDARNLGFVNQTTLTFHVHEVSQNLWHVFNTPVMHYYNPIQKTIDSTYYFSNDIRASRKINSNEYLAIGEVAGTKDFMGLPTSANTGLGFYRINSAGTILDTTVYFAKTVIQSPIFTLYSNPSLHSASFLSDDTNSIYLACSNKFSGVVGTPPEGYILVVKTDSRGSEKWRYLWGGGPRLSTAVFKILTTKNDGCIIIGSYEYEGAYAIGLIIKLGPNGTISNVEIDAPENLVSFYPNPIKDKLHYNYLPEANDQYTLEVMDMNGKPVLETALDKEKGFVTVQLKTGFYIYQLKDEAGQVMQVGKLIAEQ